MVHTNDEELLREAWERGEAVSTDCIECGQPYVIDPDDEDRDPNSGCCEECENRPNPFRDPGAIARAIDTIDDALSRAKGTTKE
jgi:hypothetical protein